MFLRLFLCEQNVLVGILNFRNDGGDADEDNSTASLKPPEQMNVLELRHALAESRKENAKLRQQVKKVMRWNIFLFFFTMINCALQFLVQIEQSFRFCATFASTPTPNLWFLLFAGTSTAKLAGSGRWVPKSCALSAKSSSSQET